MGRDTNLLGEGQKISDLFDEDGESVVPLAGDVCMEVPLGPGLEAEEKSARCGGPGERQGRRHKAPHRGGRG